MTYTQWQQNHYHKHQNILRKLTHLEDNEVIAYFRFENMVQKEPDFCYLYASHQQCHEMKRLNCYFCACPFFLFDDEGIREEEGKILYSLCRIDAKEGTRFVSEKAIHQDCSGCKVPHREGYIAKYFGRDWLACMQRETPSPQPV